MRAQHLESRLSIQYFYYHHHHHHLNVFIWVYYVYSANDVGVYVKHVHVGTSH